MVGKYTQTRQRRLRGQDRKTLATIVAIKRPLPCPVVGEEDQRKTGYILRREKKKKKTEQEEKEKKIRKKTKKKRKETKKKKKVSSMGMHQ